MEERPRVTEATPQDWEDFWYNEDVSDGCSAEKDQTIGNFRED